MTLRSYFHYEGTECDEDMERIENEKADRDSRLFSLKLQFNGYLTNVGFIVPLCLFNDY